jgi:hypothetical protein
MEQTTGVMRVVRKVPPGEPNDFDVFSNDTLIEFFEQFDPLCAHCGHCLRLDFSFGRRHRYYEHHAGLGNGTNPRKSAFRKSIGANDAMSCGSF